MYVFSIEKRLEKTIVIVILTFSFIVLKIKLILNVF